MNRTKNRSILVQRPMRSDGVVQHDDGTPTGSRSTSFFIRGILGPDAWSIFMRWLRRLAERFSVAASLVGHPGFVEPTIVRDIGDNTRLVREEQFGPILPVLRYAKVEDAIARANDTEFGLGGSVWSKNLDRAFAVASQINSGTVWINRHLNLQPDIPFRGDKQSGIGAELGHAGLDEYTQPRIINMAKQQA